MEQNWNDTVQLADDERGLSNVKFQKDLNELQKTRAETSPVHSATCSIHNACPSLAEM